ncbi:hypothetical protein BGZ61DRAFT_550181 [Ilyonectria robusta]|uniref:uncharacterized protein n=1 Tax=Ilyonectria robusta TaxID=1079257 RepID=UPI001E8DC7A5|nr:uncharacterized protein BGZ61DRAFT_550181 [Ilyonectria robusta]KAH8646529.1 hypothetical protein BGZ61DRAFT_550181 [Ilyonectria robusta]
MARRQNQRDNFPPEFWDSLSKVWLTPRALREHDRQNNTSSLRFTAPEVYSTAPEVYSADLARFARYSGPDLYHIYGHPEPRSSPHTLTSSTSSESTRTRSTTTTTVSSEGRRSSVYDKDFEQHIIDHNIYTNNLKSTPKSGTDLRSPSGERTRRSLSPSRFSDGAFEAFQKVHDEVKSEEDVMREIIPVISGDANIANSGNVVFNNLDSITDGTSVNAKPDFYDGAYPEDIDPAAKAPSKDADVAKRQACLAGAYGARAMHALQNYGQEEPQYDGNAYAYSSTYHAGTGTLKLYAHHVTAPTTEGGRPEYHMTHMRTFGMIDSREAFVQGVTAFRNTRDLAKRRRDKLIQAANARAFEDNMVVAHEGLDTATEIQYEEDSTDEPALSSHHYPYADDDSEDALGQASVAADMNDLPMSFVTSFTPSFTSSLSSHSHRTRSKRQRSPGSSAPEQGPSKSRSRRISPRIARASSGCSAGGCSRV